LDIKAPRGRAIGAAKEGTVAYSGWMGGYGKVVVINHSGSQSTLYAHCSTLVVKKGQQIKAGQKIATIGTTGQSTGPHVHFEVRDNNSPINPLRFLK
jgi:murein DD-endopeptidase MepM/ murein hydrolase activator NlpD